MTLGLGTTNAWGCQRDPVSAFLAGALSGGIVLHLMPQNGLPVAAQVIPSLRGGRRYLSPISATFMGHLPDCLTQADFPPTPKPLVALLSPCSQPCLHHEDEQVVHWLCASLIVGFPSGKYRLASRAVCLGGGQGQIAHAIACEQQLLKFSAIGSFSEAGHGWFVCGLLCPTCI
jgi:hypothetical protein